MDNIRRPNSMDYPDVPVGYSSVGGDRTPYIRSDSDDTYSDEEIQDMKNNPPRNFFISDVATKQVVKPPLPNLER